MQSRHKNSKTYFIYVSFDEQSVDEWCCSCFMGMRTVGCCSHIAAVIVYFSTGKQIPKGVKKVDHFMELFQKCPHILLLDSEDEDADNEIV